jgi:hypothetical protein
MGRQPPVGYLTRAETAKELHVSKSTLAHMVRKGLLIPQYFNGNGQFFLLGDLQALQLATNSREPDARQSHATALMALSAARRADQRVEELFGLMGLDVVALQRDPESVWQLYAEVHKSFRPGDVKNVVFLRYWGGTFFSMEEAYLELVEHVTGDVEPWKVFHDFALRVTQVIIEEDESALYVASKYFQAGRAHLRYVSYLHCRRRHGRRIADAVFEGAQTAVQELQAILRY